MCGVGRNDCGPLWLRFGIGIRLWLRLVMMFIVVGIVDFAIKTMAVCMILISRDYLRGEDCDGGG